MGVMEQRSREESRACALMRAAGAAKLALSDVEFDLEQ
jgi:hypothetical protein